MKQRITWIDQLRGIAMFSVVIGHVALPKETISLIYSFHMPLFFMISGMTLNDGRILRTPLIPSIIDKAKKLIVPYLWMSFIMFPMWFVTWKMIASTKSTIFQVFKGILYGNNVDYYSGTSNALWFLLTLFFANILYSVLVKIANGNEGVLATATAVCGVIGFLDKGVAQIWHFNVAFTAVVFMYIGRCIMLLYKEHTEWFESRKEKSKYLLMLVLYVLGVFFHRQNGRISMTANKFGSSPVLYYVTAITLSFAIILTVILLPKIKFFEYVGKNTLLYVGLHVPLIRLFEQAFPEIKASVLYSFLLGLGVYIVMAGICAIFNKCFPFVCAKPSFKGDKLVEAGKYLMTYTSLITPVYAVLQKLTPDLPTSTMVVMLAVVTLIPTVVFVLVADKFLPFVFFSKEKN